MSTIDYGSVTRADLEMTREPRKSQFTVVHKPTGTVATDPVVPGSYAPARFRRPTNLPKENRQVNMEGYIESTNEEDTQLYVITIGDEASNEYLDALVGDTEALRISFEGRAGVVAPTVVQSGQQTAPEAATEAPSPDAVSAGAPMEEVSESDPALAARQESEADEPQPNTDIVPEAVGDVGTEELDDILAKLNS